MPLARNSLHLLPYGVLGFTMASPEPMVDRGPWQTQAYDSHKAYIKGSCRPRSPEVIELGTDTGLQRSLGPGSRQTATPGAKRGALGSSFLVALVRPEELIHGLHLSTS